MTVLNRSHIPAGINSYERAFAWLAMVIQFLCAGKQVKVVENGPMEQMCQVSQVVCADGNQYFQIIAYMPVSVVDLNSPTAKTWMAVNDISNAALHANLISD